jgi:integrase
MKILEQPSHYYVFGKKDLTPNFERAAINLPNRLHKEILIKLKMYRFKETVLYSWKHTGNINAYLKGMDIKLIQQINGHTSLETTEIYLRKLGLFLDKQAFDFEF